MTDTATRGEVAPEHPYGSVEPLALFGCKGSAESGGASHDFWG